MPFIQGNAEFGPRSPRPVKYCSKPQKQAQPGDILLSVRAPVGALNLTDRPLCIGRGLSAITATGVESAFLWHALRREVPRLARVSQGSTFASVNKADLYALDIPLPLPNEQRKIAAILSSVDDAIEKTQAVIDQVQVVKRGLMRELLARGLPGRHTRFKPTEIGAIPEGWRVVVIGELGHDSRSTVRTGPFGSSMKTEDFRPSGVPVLTIQSLGKGELNAAGVFFVSQEKADELSEYSVTEGDLVFSRVADIGRSLAVDERLSGWLISPNLMRIRLDHRKVDARFMMYSIDFARAVQRQIGHRSNNCLFSLHFSRDKKGHSSEASHSRSRAGQ